MGRDRDGVSRPTIAGVDFAALCQDILVHGEFGAGPSFWFLELQVEDEGSDVDFLHSEATSP